MTRIKKILEAALVAASLMAIVAAPTALTGCAVFGVPKAQNFNERVDAGYVLVATVADAVAASFSAGKISQDAANAALDEVKKANKGIDLAVSIAKSGDFDQAETRLSATIAALELLQAELRSK